MACSRIVTFAINSLVAAALVGCGNGDATGPNGNGPADLEFEWSGTIAQGDQIEIKGVQGNDVQVTFTVSVPAGVVT